MGWADAPLDDTPTRTAPSSHGVVPPDVQAARDKDAKGILQRELADRSAVAASATDPDQKRRAQDDVTSISRELGVKGALGKTSAPTPARASATPAWASAPLDDQTDAEEAPPPDTGADAIPVNAAGLSTGAQRRQQIASGQIEEPTPTPQATMPDKITGAVQAGLNLATSLVGGLVGAVTGTVQHAAEGVGAITTAADRASRGLPATLPGEDKPIGLGEAQAQHAGAVAQALRNIPLDSEDTAKGQEYTQALQPAVETLNALGGHIPEMGAMHEMAGPAGPAGAQVSKAVRENVAPVANKAAAAAGSAVGSVARRVIGVDPELAKVAQIAGDLKYPIDVRPDQVVGNAKYSKLAGQASSDVPFAGSKNEPNQIAFTKNLIDMINPEETGDRLTPQAYDKAMDRSGSAIGEIYADNPTPLEKLAPGLDSLKSKLDTASDENTRIVGSFIKQLESKADENGVVNGTTLRELNSEIGKRARTEAGNDLGSRLDQLQDVIRRGVQDNIEDPAEKQALSDYSRQYAYGKLVEPIVAKTIDGLVSPAELMARVTATKAGKHFMAKDMGGPIGDLAKVGQLIKEPGSSGTAERSLLYGAVKDTGKTLAAVAGGYPAAAAYNIGGPHLTRMMVGKRPKKAVAPPPEPPPEPTTSPGAGPGTPPPSGGSPGPLGDLTPDWQTTPGAGGVARRGEEPGLVRSVDEPPISGRGHEPGAAPPQKPGSQIPLVDTRRLGDLTPEWETTSGAGGTAHERETGLHRAADEPGLAPGNGRAGKNAGNQIPAVEGRPDLPQRMLVGQTKEVAASDRANAAMLTPGATEARARFIDSDMRRKNDALRESENIPVGETAEGQPPIKTEKPGKIPVGKATEITPEEYAKVDAQWRSEHKLGAEDAARAKDVAEALGHDSEAVHAAVKQFERQPRAFDREIARINEEGRAHENETKQSAEGSQGDAGGAGAPSGDNSPAPVRTGEGDSGRAAPVSGEQAKSDSTGAVRTTSELPGADSPAKTGTGRNVDRTGAPYDMKVTPTNLGADRGTKSVMVEARDPKTGERRGVIDFGVRGDGVLTAENVKVAPDFQRRGIAEMMYKAARDAGHDIAPGRVQTDVGQAMVERLQAKGLINREAEGPRTLARDLVKATTTKRVKDADGTHTVVTLPDGSTRRIQRLNSTESMGLPGWHDMDAPSAHKSYIADTEAEAIKEIERDTAKQPQQPGDLRQENRGEAAQSSKPGGPDEPEEIFKEGSQESGKNGVGAANQRRPIGSAGAMDMALRERFGDKFIQGLKDQGILKYDALSPRHHSIGATLDQGLRSGNKPAATLFYGKLTAEELPGVLMHELGEHFGIVRLLGSERYNVMLNDLKALRDTPEVKEAWETVKRRYTGDKSQSKLTEGGTTFMREVAAHLVEDHPDLPFVRRLINEIRAYFYEHFGTTLGNKVDASLVRGLAASALRKASEGMLDNMKTPVPVSPAKTYQPMLARRGPSGGVPRPTQ